MATSEVFIVKEIFVGGKSCISMAVLARSALMLQNASSNCSVQAKSPGLDYTSELGKVGASV